MRGGTDAKLYIFENDDVITKVLHERGDDMFNTVENLGWRKKLEEYVDHCELRAPEEVARLFKEYTLLVWDFKLLGRIYDFYSDDAIMYVSLFKISSDEPNSGSFTK